MKQQKKFWITLVMTLALLITSCGSKQNQTQTDTTDSTTVDAIDALVEEQYDFEAIAKAIEGCEYLTNFDNGVAMFTKNGEHFYIDLQGRIVEEPKVEEDPDNLSCEYKNGKYGYKDQTGNVVIPYIFHFAHGFSDGMAIVVNEEGKVGYINTKGELAIPYQYGTMAESDGNDFHEGLCAVLVDDAHEWFSYVDKTGKLAFEGVFSMAGNFSEGMAAVRIPGNSEEHIESHAGYIDRSGKMIIELPDGWWGREFRDGVAQTQRVDSCYIIDKTGKRLFQVNSDMIYTGDDIRFSEGLAVVYGMGKYEKKRGFMDKTGRITFCLSEDNIDESSEQVLVPDLTNVKPLDLSDGKDEAAKLFPHWDVSDVYEDEGELVYDLNLGYNQPLQRLYKPLPGKPLNMKEAIRVVIIDLNKDGYSDALICLGRYGNDMTLYFDAYVWDEKDDDGAFEYVENFRKIPNPRIDKDFSGIIGRNGNDREMWGWRGKNKVEKSLVTKNYYK